MSVDEARPIHYAHPVPQFGCAECREAAAPWQCRCGDWRIPSSSRCLVCKAKRPKRRGTIVMDRPFYFSQPVHISQLELCWAPVKESVGRALSQRNPLL